MASSGSSVTQWRVLAQVRDYLVKTVPTVSALHKDAPHFFKKFTDVLQKDTEGTTESGVKKTEEVGSTNNKQLLKTEDVPSENMSDLQKAIKTVNTLVPLYFSQVRLNFANNNKQNVAEKNIPKWRTRTATVSKASIDARTRILIKGLGVHLTEGGRLRKIQDLCQHLKNYPQAKGLAVKRGGIQRLLIILENTKDESVVCEAREALALLGYIRPVRGHGIRILTIDGGGIRGLVALEVLKKLEENIKQPIHEAFDYICGVSTGAILAVLIGSNHTPLDQCETMYKDLSSRIFTQTTLKGATSLVMRNSYYDSDCWTNILKETMGEEVMIETARNADTPKICIVATSTNINRVQAYLLRNYNLPYRVTSHYQGTSLARLWQATRASAAAPGYFSEFKIENQILLDGGVYVNNPTAIAIHEAKQLWPATELQCVVSVGTGRHEPIATVNEDSISWATRLRTIVNSATDTEGVHTTMHDLLPGDVYFRFNPYLSDEIGLDEIGEERLATMMEDTALYLRKNEQKIVEASNALTKVKTPFDHMRDWYHHQLQLRPST